MFTSYYFVLCLLGCIHSGIPHAFRIYNGSLAEPGLYPFQVSMQRNEIHICGATIVTPIWILTAAHCFLTKNGTHLDTTGNYSVLAGTVDLRRGGIRRLVVEILLHDFNARLALNDIALLRLETSLPFNRHIKPVELPLNDTILEEGSEVTVIGWGRTEKGSGSPLLRTVDVKVFTLGTCSPLLHSPPNEEDICAGLTHGGKGACVGDSGGPLLVNGVQEGIVSWGSKKCASLPHPLAVYTNVGRYINWIKKHTGIQNHLYIDH